MNVAENLIVLNFRVVGQYKIDFFAFLCYNNFVRLKKTLASNLSIQKKIPPKNLHRKRVDTVFWYFLYHIIKMYKYINFNRYPETTPKYPDLSLVINLKPIFSHIPSVVYEVEQLFETNGVSKEEIAEFHNYIEEAPTPEEALKRVQEWAYVVYKYIDNEGDDYYDAEEYLY